MDVKKFKETRTFYIYFTQGTVDTLIETGGSSFKAPWFGQLMRDPQLLAYLIQVNNWLKDYNVKIKLQ